MSNRTIWQRAKGWLAKTAIKAAVNVNFIPKWVRSSFTRWAFDTLVTDAYKGNGTVYACLLVLNLTFPEPELWPWRLVDGKEAKIPNHKLRTLMRKPNSDMGEAELMRFVITYCALGGNIYLWKQRNGAKEVISLWPFHDGDMEPVPGRDAVEGLVAYYVLDVGDGTMSNPYGVERFDALAGMAIPKSEIIHWKWMLDPLQPWRGIGALEAIAGGGDIDISNEVRRFVYALLKNDAKPPFVVTMPEDEILDTPTLKRVRKQWQEEYGEENRGMPAFLEFGQKIQELGYDLQRLNYDSLRDGPDAAICMSFHLSPVVVGALVGLENSTYSNYEEARKALAQDTLRPLWRSFASEVEQGMSGERGYAGEVMIRHDLSQVAALQEDQEKLWTRALSAFNGSGITRAEYRQLLGYPARPGDEVYKETLTMVYTPVGTAREPVQPTSTQDAPPKALPAIATKRTHEQPPDQYERKNFPDGDGGAGQRSASVGAYRRMKGAVNQLQAIRETLLPQMETAVAGYFAEYGQRAKQAVLSLKGAAAHEQKSPLTPQEWAYLENALFQQEKPELIRRIVETYQVQIAAASWELWNVMLDANINFQQNDPVVAQLLSLAGDRVRNISDSTKDQLRAYLQYGSQNGWSTDELAYGRGDRPGIADFISETYLGRAETIARTELGTAQQMASTSRYAAAGVRLVLVFDDGFDNSHPACVMLDGTIQTLAWANANPLQHPNCVRAFAPYYED